MSVKKNNRRAEKLFSDVRRNVHEMAIGFTKNE